MGETEGIDPFGSSSLKRDISNQDSGKPIFCNSSLYFSLKSLACFNYYEPPLLGCANNSCALFPENSKTSSEKLLANGIETDLVSARYLAIRDDSGPEIETFLYVGIWYKNTSYTHVIWVLNNKKPITDSPGTLIINSEGNLVLVDGGQSLIWSTNVSTISNNTRAAKIDDTGNFALTENGSTLWESFDHPCNTLIPNMKLGGNDELGISLTLTSWTNDNNPTPGKFFLRRNRAPLEQIYVMMGSQITIVNGSGEVKYWSSGPWNGRSFSGIPGMSQDYINGLTFSTDGDGGQYYTYSTYSSSQISIWFLNSSGNLEVIDWDEQNKYWVDEWAAIESKCDVYGTCGPFGICNKMESSICSCMRGFQPKFPEKWNNGNWSDGCVRTSQLRCGNESEGFQKMEGMKLPDLAEYGNVQDVTQCEGMCLNNCSCLAYAYLSGPGCLFWSTNLVDVQQFTANGTDLFLRLPTSELDKPGKIKTYVIVLIAVLGTFTVILVATLFILYRYKRKQKAGKNKTLPNASGLVEVTQSSTSSLRASFLKKDTVMHVEDQEQFSNGNHAEDHELQLFDFGIVQMATKNFSFGNRIGEGGFGPVYKGDLSNGQVIAVKRLSRTSGQGMTEFKNEVMLISKLQHRNLVKLVGLCIEGEEKLLLYEYLINKSLDKIIFDPTKQAGLDWTKRFRIIEGIACGLLYLHRDSRLRVIHRDLKASNILLDEDLNPKISDFGMARIFGGKQDLANTNRVVGTYGYMAPEYALEGIFSEKSDVFSFGILLLEIVSGIRNYGFCHDEEHLSLLGYAWKLWNEDLGRELIDQTIVKSCNPSEAMRCIHIGLLCVQDYVVDRPTMSKVVFMLSTDTTLPAPKMPVYIQDKNFISLYGSDAYSVNECSMTGIESR
ncbi:hypothetical protein NE237_030531 [Protea cynaroides]|uniref:Receptor-like serine/threonine-protein kinase n=1 Tax=Protea cynaroides TaxID=273540 RepID=A0A9Q0GUA2_9MAGN|nr:hypothetical protein NE237_030531 [Protea cynaroides]